MRMSADLHSLLTRQQDVFDTKECQIDSLSTQKAPYLALFESSCSCSDLVRSPTERAESQIRSETNTITRIPIDAQPRSSTHFSDRTALVCSGCLPPWPMREASAQQKTRNQLMLLCVTHVAMLMHVIPHQLAAMPRCTRAPGDPDGTRRR